MKKLILLIFISNALLINSQNSDYVPFQTQQPQYNQEYVPFEDGISYTLSNNERQHKCEYCGKPDANANCHGHEKWCPYHCDDDDDYNSVPLEFDTNTFVFLIVLAGIYAINKIPRGLKTSSVKG